MLPLRLCDQSTSAFYLYATGNFQSFYLTASDADQWMCQCRCGCNLDLRPSEITEKSICAECR